MGADAPIPSRARLLELVDAMAGQPVLVVADLVLDRFITGSPKRISREAPVLILRHEGELLVPGGGANAIANVRSLGGEPLAVGVVGDDDDGRALRGELVRRGVSDRGILTFAGYRTPAKTRILAGFPHGSKQQVVRYDLEDTLPEDQPVASRLAAAIDAWRGRARVAVVSDYGYGAATPARLSAVRDAVGPSGMVLVDSRYRLQEFSGVDGATPNEEEAEALAGRRAPEDGLPLARWAEGLRQTIGARFLLITRGSRGLLLARGGGALAVPVHGTAQVADVTGAGDTVIGTFALAIAAGAEPEEAALLADYAGGIVVMKMGTATLDRPELAAAVSDDPQPRREARWARC